MFTCLILLITFIPIAFLPLALNAYFSPDDLSEMGIDADVSI